MRDVNIEKVLVSNKIPFGEKNYKYFIGYLYNNHKVKPLHIKCHGDEVTDVYVKKVPKVDSSHTCLAVISLDSALKKDENYYPQVF